MKVLLLMLLMSYSPESDLTPKNVYQYCIEQDIQHPEIVTAQAIWETGWFNCDNCSLDCNNIFGFYYKGRYIKYDDWRASVRYYKRWQDKFYQNDRNYYDFLACIYKTKNGKCLKYAENPDQYNISLQGTIAKHLNEWRSN